MNIPNALTGLRILLIPVLVVWFYIPGIWSQIIAAALFTLAGITDWLDGYLARRLNQSTPFGAFLDPVADKLMVAIALVLLVEHYGAWWFTLPACVIIGREIVISALREWMAELGKRASVAVSYVGKIKTTVQFAAIAVLLVCEIDRSGTLYWLGLFALYVAAALTLWSMLIYLRAAWPLLSPFSKP
ncbi:MAG TPA: CDP-diacylglycerol--glycerol-3-phosphate 3-phosphatidyltransferase [Spongiibacteraceae bacterium]|jgi:CDP-diacylglycerol--glycerol-3-phosphate 3-phosphatidyltransferase|nr:CDP-diacylglycerol--glycerol-3-phosphate 3-phosphatidyltransferase [Spongiibacteraceae bacterium]HUH39050.1 CDP-diacylglycerol--glycerol-3-phosphate 3-phosphatidyltransferase [Spongiibacteraceae bacterium]